LLQQITELVSSGKHEKLSAMNVKGAFRYQFFAAGTYGFEEAGQFILSCLNWFLAIKEQVFFNLKKAYQQFSAKRRPFD
jgi:hypothetical protein